MRYVLALSVLGFAGAAYWLTRTPGDEMPQASGNLAALLTPAEMSTTTTTTGAANERAFLAAIRAAEGTAGPNGYRTMFGGGLFDSFADHPRQAHQFTTLDGRKLWTTAAGAFQFMARSPLPTGGATRVDTWGECQRALNLPDFSPESQDAAALYLVDRCGALGDVRAGRFASAVAKCRKVWASLPGAGYSQPERSLAWLQDRYQAAGGAFA